MSLIIPDPRLESPDLYDPRRKTSGPVVINESDSITRELRHHWQFSRPGDYKDMVSGAVLSEVGSGNTWKSSPQGLMIKTTTAGDLVTSGLNLSGASGLTVIAHCRDYVATNWDALFGFSSANNDAVYFARWGSSPNDITLFGSSTTNNDIVAHTGANASSIDGICLAFTLDDLTGGTARAYIDGKLSATDAYANDYTSALTTFGLGDNGSGDTTDRSIEIGFLTVAIFARALPGAEISTLSRNINHYVIPA